MPDWCDMEDIKFINFIFIVYHKVEVEVEVFLSSKKDYHEVLQQLNQLTFIEHKIRKRT